MSNNDLGNRLAAIEALTLSMSDSDTDRSASSDVARSAMAPTERRSGDDRKEPFQKMGGPARSSTRIGRVETNLKTDIRNLNRQPSSVSDIESNPVERVYPPSSGSVAHAETPRRSRAMTRATSTPKPDPMAQTNAILKHIRDELFTGLPAWKSRFSGTANVRLFDLVPNRPTFYPDEKGHFSGQVRVTVHEDAKLPSGRPVTASRTLHAVVEGRVTDQDAVTIENVELAPR
jgi:hypothetical protein